MAKIIKLQGATAELVRNTWINFEKTAEATLESDWHDDGALPPGGLIVSLAVWLKHREALLLHPRTGVLLEPGDDPALLAEDIERIGLIAISFPKFTDGRGFSSARLLRERYGFKGELRAVGQILPDTVFFLSRAGFDAFKLPEQHVDDALTALRPFSVRYQSAFNEAPLFLRRAA